MKECGYKENKKCNTCAECMSCSENNEPNCDGCSHEYVKYVGNGTKSFCDIDEREIFPTSKRCDAYSKEPQFI